MDRWFDLGGGGGGHGGGLECHLCVRSFAVSVLGADAFGRTGVASRVCTGTRVLVAGCRNRKVLV